MPSAASFQGASNADVTNRHTTCLGPQLCPLPMARTEDSETPNTESMRTGILRHTEAFHVVLLLGYHVLNVYMCQAVLGLHTLSSIFKTTLQGREAGR